MSFAIMRTQKLKSAVAVRGSLKHSYREQETPNADESRSNKNVVLVGANNSKEAMQDFRSKLPEKIRKNGVQCVELLITSSNEAMNNKSYDEQMTYFKDSLDWIADKFGGKENIINAGVHFDETTPHMYVYLVPLDENGKLNCRKFMGGTRDVMSKLQDSFAEEVGNKHRLNRGIKGSKAKHKTIKSYYKELNESVVSFEQSKNIITSEDLKPQSVPTGKSLLGIGFNRLESQEEMARRLNRKFFHATDNIKSHLLYQKIEQKQINDLKRCTAESIKKYELIEKEYAVFKELKRLSTPEFEKFKRVATSINEEKQKQIIADRDRRELEQRRARNFRRK